MSFDFTVKEFILGNGTGTPTFQFYRRGFNLNGSSGGGGWTDIILHGNTALTLTNAKANGLNYVKLFGGTEQRNLPKGYTQYEYLRSSGTQYIDLGYKGKGNTKVEIKFRYYQTSSATGSGRVFGSRTTATSNAFAIGASSGVVASTNNKIFWCYDGQPFFVDNTEFGLDEWKTVVFSATEHTIDGVTVGDDYEVTEFETPNNLKLFGFDNNGTIGVGYVDIAYCQLWDDDGTLVRDVVPAYDGTTYSMYDKVSGTMLPNAGTGDFVAGSAVVPTPDEPLQIVSNNGIIKYSANMANVNEQTALVGYYISNSGVVTADTKNWIYQDYIPVEPSTTYTLTISTPVYYVTISEYSTADDSGFIRRNAGSTGGSTTLTITTRSTARYIRFGANIDSSDVTLNRVIAINWMLNKGNSLPYAPYSEDGIYTDGTVETVEVTGKNLFNIADADWGYNINASGVRTVSQYNSNSNYVKVKPNTQYTCSLVSHSASDSIVIRFHAYNSSKTWLEQIGTKTYSSDGLQTYTFTTSANTEYIIFTFRGNSSSASDLSTNIQLELGSTATTYEPYFNGGTATAEMLLAVGSYQDIQSVLDGEVTRKVGIKVFDGTENWTANTVSSGRLVFYVTKASIGSDSTVLPNGSSNIKCSHFETSTAAAQSLYGTVWAGGTAINFTAGDFCADLATWTQWLVDQYNAGTPVIIVYPLATATTETVTGKHLSIQAGTNIVEITQASIDNLGLEVSYKGKEGE